MRMSTTGLEQRYKIFGKRVRELREHRGLDSLELARMIGYTNGSALTQLEAGTYNIPLEKLLRLADALGVAPAYLLMEGPAVLDALISEAQRCSPEEQQALANFLSVHNNPRRPQAS